MSQITIANLECCLSEPVGWDIHRASYVSATWWLNPVQECLIQADFQEKGPRGTGESQFDMFRAELPEHLLRGWLLQEWSWSEEPLGVRLTIRPGIRWQANANLHMKGRSFTAQDVADWINAYRASPGKGCKMRLFMEENAAVPIDGTTVFVHFKKPFASWPWVLGYSLYANVYPMEQRGYTELPWECVAGTGPYILRNYTEGSGAIYEANPDWWAGRAGADWLFQPVYPSAEEAVRALAEGRVDIMDAIPVSYKSFLKEKCPELMMRESPSGAAVTVAFNSLRGPCASRDFRRALIMGTDLDTLARNVEGASPGGFPFSRALGSSFYTRPSELPGAGAELYRFDPEKAVTILRDKGFEQAAIKLYYTDDNEDIVNAALFLSESWRALGVDVDLIHLDVKTLTSMWTGDGSDWEGAIIYHGTNAKTARGIENERIKAYLSCSRDAAFNAEMDAIMAETNPDIRNRMVKESAAGFIERVDEFGLFEMNTLTCWWPWVKNYHGETESGNSGNLAIIAAFAQIDEEEKQLVLTALDRYSYDNTNLI